MGTKFLKENFKIHGYFGGVVVRMILKEYGAELYHPLASYSELRIRDKNAWGAYSEQITKVWTILMLV